MPKVDDSSDEIDDLPEFDDEGDEIDNLPEFDDEGDELDDLPNEIDEEDELSDDYDVNDSSGNYDTTDLEPGDLYPKYQRIMEEEGYSSVEEMCNDLGLNYEDVYLDPSDFPEDDGTEEFKDSIYTDEGIEANEKIGLTDEEKALIKNETGWSDEIIDHIESMEQYEIYKNADLHEVEINGRKCLVKDIDMDYVDPKTGKTNRELMESGKSPIDSKTGEKIELHHMGQDYDSPFAELCENSEHGDGNHSVLHTKTEEGWRNNPELRNRYNNVDKPNHWIKRAEER